MSKHTPKPWKAVNSNSGWYIRQPDGRSTRAGIIPTSYGWQSINPRPTTEGDAHLIAAAPDLLEACRELRYWLRSYVDAQSLTKDCTVVAEVITNASAAIAKAEGTSND